MLLRKVGSRGYVVDDGRTDAPQRVYKARHSGHYDVSLLRRGIHVFDGLFDNTV